jgi:hypothetical protein
LPHLHLHFNLKNRLYRQICIDYLSAEIISRKSGLKYQKYAIDLFIQTMNTDKINALINDLKQLKDELTVKANLGVAEAQDELKKLEPVFDDLKEKAGKIADVTGDSASELKAAAELGIDAKSSDDVDTALELAADELKSAYGKIKDILS